MSGDIIISDDGLSITIKLGSSVFEAVDRVRAAAKAKEEDLTRWKPASIKPDWPSEIEMAWVGTGVVAKGGWGTCIVDKPDLYYGSAASITVSEITWMDEKGRALPPPDFWRAL